MNRVYTINMVPSDCRYWLDGREIVRLSLNGNLYYWDVPNNDARTNKVTSVMETGSHIVVWVVDVLEKEEMCYFVQKPQLSESISDWLEEKELLRYLAPVSFPSGTPVENELMEACLIGMPDSARGEFISWSKGFSPDRYPDAKEALIWIQDKY